MAITLPSPQGLSQRTLRCKYPEKTLGPLRETLLKRNNFKELI
jgi:hypothetical protein